MMRPKRCVSDERYRELTSAKTLLERFICYTAVHRKTQIAVILCAVVLAEGLAEASVGLSQFSGDPFPEYIVEKVDYSCGKTRLCNSSLGRYGTWKCVVCEECYCDDSCFSHGDCCLDKYFEPSANPESPNLSNFVSCLEPFPKQETLFAVVRCPPSSGQENSDVVRCERPDLSDMRQGVLVTDSSTNMTFRNEYCARCHGVQSYKAWKNKASCKYTPRLSQISSKTELWAYVLGEGNCNITSKPPEGDAIRPCVGEMIRTCNNSGNWIERNATTELLCESLYSPIQYIHHTVPEEAKHQWYQNVFCLLCDGVELAPRFHYCRPGARRFTPKPLSVLMDFNREDLLEEPIINQTTCDTGMVLDPFSGICKRMECSDRRLMGNNVCSPRFSAPQWLGYSFSVTMTTLKEQPVSDWSNISRTYEGLVREVISEFAPYVFTPLTLTVFVTSSQRLATQEQLRFHSLLVESRVVSSSSKSSQLFEQRLRSLQTTPWVMRSADSAVTFYPEPSACRATINESSSVSVYNRSSFSDDLTVMHFESEKCDQQCFKAIEYKDIETILDCPYVVYNLTYSAFSIDKERNEIVFSGRRIQVNISDYYVCGDQAKICINVLDKIAMILDTIPGIKGSVRSSPERVVLGTVSFACTLVSLVALVLTFAIYSILPKLRTLPGKNTMALVFHLFLAQLIFLVANSLTDDVVACQIIGLLTHYFWIVTFAWMAICAYHMYRVFTDLLASRHHSVSDQTILVRFSLGANLSSLAVVLACLAYHLIESQGNETGYGGVNCFILNPIVLGVAFAAPICLVLLCNVFFFIRTVLSIRSIPNLKHSTHNSNRRHVGIYFRLSVLLGFTWVFAFVQEIKSSIYLEYLFVILNGCQGLFIFVAFCLNRRTFGLLKEKFFPSSSKHNGSTTPKTDSTAL